MRSYQGTLEHLTNNSNVNLVHILNVKNPYTTPLRDGSFCQVVRKLVCIFGDGPEQGNIIRLQNVGAVRRKLLSDRTSQNPPNARYCVSRQLHQLVHNSLAAGNMCQILINDWLKASRQGTDRHRAAIPKAPLGGIRTSIMLRYGDVALRY